jgi:hypothetical protein
MSIFQQLIIHLVLWPWIAFTLFVFGTWCLNVPHVDQIVCVFVYLQYVYLRFYFSLSVSQSLSTLSLSLILLSLS